jgi:hypothetical protein
MARNSGTVTVQSVARRYTGSHLPLSIPSFSWLLLCRTKGTGIKQDLGHNKIHIWGVTRNAVIQETWNSAKHAYAQTEGPQCAINHSDSEKSVETVLRITHRYGELWRVDIKWEHSFTSHWTDRSIRAVIFLWAQFEYLGSIKRRL